VVVTDRSLEPTEGQTNLPKQEDRKGAVLRTQKLEVRGKGHRLPRSPQPKLRRYRAHPGLMGLNWRWGVLPEPQKP
jgi:hypothetical protein